MSIIGILLGILMLGVLFWAAQQLIKAFSIPQPIATVILVILVLLALVFIVGQFGYGPGVNLKL